MGERLTPMDLSNLRFEEHSLPMHIAALAFLDRAPLKDEYGRPDLDRLREHVDQRTREAPRLRQRLSRPGPGRGPAKWVDDPAFDVAQHVRLHEVPVPRDEAALLALCTELNRPALDRGRPLWELWLLPGLRDGRVGLLLRLHHVVADGAAALELLGALFDGPLEVPAPRPATAAHAPEHQGVGTRARAFIRQLVVLVRLGTAPRLSFNRPIGTRSRIALVRGDLSAAKRAAHARGGTVNDLALAVVAGGARRLLDGRGELRAGLRLHVSVPASLRTPGAAAPSGNRVGVRIVPVPVDEPDPGRRLKGIAATTRAQRGLPPYLAGARFAQRWIAKVMRRQRIINLVVSNLPGPTTALTFADATVREVFQIGGPQGNVPVIVGVLSYAGQLNFTVVTDDELLPETDEFSAGLTEDLGDLGAAR